MGVILRLRCGEGRTEHVHPFALALERAGRSSQRPPTSGLAEVHAGASLCQFLSPSFWWNALLIEV